MRLPPLRLDIVVCQPQTQTSTACEILVGDVVAWQQWERRGRWDGGCGGGGAWVYGLDDDGLGALDGEDLGGRGGWDGGVEAVGGAAEGVAGVGGEVGGDLLVEFSWKGREGCHCCGGNGSIYAG